MPLVRSSYRMYILGAVLIGFACYFVVPRVLSKTYVRGNAESVEEQEEVSSNIKSDENTLTETSTIISISHIATPSAVKGLYMTSWVAGTTSMRDHVIGLVDTTEANTIVFDIKDDTGKISYPVEDPELVAIGSSEKRIPNLRTFTNLLHSKNIYVIGRIASFQDPYLVKKFPESAVKTLSDKTKVWKDRKGLTWIDAGDARNWEYLTRIAKDAYAQGVDEVQFDYIRFPTDGNMKDIYFPASDGKSKVDAVRGFMEHINEALTGTGVKTSADLFGMATTNTDDLGIGQILEVALANFDYVSPMVYPSHWPTGWNGFKDPEFKPYDTIKISMGKAVERAQISNIDIQKLRPWLQDFSLRTKYGPTEVRAQIQATYDVGLTSWLLWDPSTKFTKGALLVE